MSLDPGWRGNGGHPPPAVTHSPGGPPLESTRRELVGLLDVARRLAARSDVGVEGTEVGERALQGGAGGARTAMKLFIAELQRQLADFARHFDSDIDAFVARESAALLRRRTDLEQVCCCCGCCCCCQR